MDSYMQKAVAYHGHKLLDAMRIEQSDNITNKSFAWKQKELDGPKSDVFLDDDKKSMLISFIAKKADMLFKPYMPSETILNSATELEDKDKYAIVPPLECFMNVDNEARKQHFYKSLSKGDVVIGRVTGKHIHGLIITLLCLNAGKMRLIDDLNIKCFCHLHHIPQVSAHENPLDEFNVNDLVQGVVNEMSAETEKIYITMIETTFAHVTHLHLKLGLITDDDLPLHFKKSSKYCGDSFESSMNKTLGFMNPTIVPQLGLKMGVNVKRWPSLMRGLHAAEYPKADYASELYKTQCSQWAYKSVKQGVDYFKAGNNVEAFQCLNKALQIDPANVEAFVARGALYANNNCLSRALEDFEKALEIDANHVNARKFIVTTLIAFGKQLEDDGRIEDAIRNFKKAMIINPTSMEAMQHMKLSQKKLAEQEDSRIRSQETTIDECGSTDGKTKKEQTTKERLKQLLSVERQRSDGDKHREKKRQKSMSPVELSTSSSDSSSSSDSTTSESSSSSTDSSFENVGKVRKRKNGRQSGGSRSRIKYKPKISDRKSVDSNGSKRKRSLSQQSRRSSGDFEKCSTSRQSDGSSVSRRRESGDADSSNNKSLSRDLSKYPPGSNSGFNHRTSRQSSTDSSQSTSMQQLNLVEGSQGRFPAVHDNLKKVASCSKTPTLNELESFLASLKAAKTASVRKN